MLRLMWELVATCMQVGEGVAGSYGYVLLPGIINKLSSWKFRDMDGQGCTDWDPFLQASGDLDDKDVKIFD